MFFNFDKELEEGHIPYSVKYLTFGYKFNQSLKPNVLPNSIIRLVLGCCFNKKLFIGSIPNSVLNLNLGTDFNQILDIGIIPNSVTSIGNDAFHDCTALTSITFNGKLPTMGVNAFSSISNNVTVYYYSSKIDIKKLEPLINSFQLKNVSFKEMVLTTTVPQTTTGPPTTTGRLVLLPGINRISDTEVSIDVGELLKINTDILKAIDEIMLDLYPKNKYTTEQKGDILYVYIGAKTDFTNIERYDDTIRYVIFRFTDKSDTDKLLKLDINKYKSKNYMIYIIILILTLIICYVVYKLLIR
jgi:hypothetical protein